MEHFLETDDGTSGRLRQFYCRRSHLTSGQVCKELTAKIESQ